MAWLGPQPRLRLLAALSPDVMHLLRQCIDGVKSGRSHPVRTMARQLRCSRDCKWRLLPGEGDAARDCGCGSGRRGVGNRRDASLLGDAEGGDGSGGTSGCAARATARRRLLLGESGAARDCGCDAGRHGDES